METFRTVFNPFIDFLFPKSPKLASLDALDISHIIKLFPPSRLNEKDIISLFDYKNDLVKDFVWEIKYKGNRNLAKKAAQIMYEVICQELSERILFENFVNPFLLPMPTSSKRRREKGFNQIEIICEEIKKLDKEDILNYEPLLLKKLKHTESQTKTHSKAERFENLKNSMKVFNYSVFKRACVVLVDDVFTTGASVAEAKRALKEVGVRKILTITFAH